MTEPPLHRSSGARTALRLAWWQYLIGIGVALVCLLALAAVMLALVGLARAVQDFPLIASLAWLGTIALLVLFAVVALLVGAALIGMGIDIAESWLWPSSPRHAERSRPKPETRVTP